jgi:hypothetical protein
MASAPNASDSQPITNSTDSPQSGGSAQQIPLPPGISAELMNLLFRAALISGRHEKDVNLSFTSILLAFLASNNPSSLWFQSYVRDANIDVGRMMSSQNVDEPFLLKLRTELGDDRRMLGMQPTQSAQNIMRAAEELRKKIESSLPPSPAPPDWVSELYPHNVMAAYIYRCPKEHEKQLDSWGFKRVNWSNAFLGYISSQPTLSDVELKHWVEAHREAFKQEPQIPSPAEATPLAPPDMTPMHLDSPTAVDYLGRKGFAEALAVRLNRVWSDSNQTRTRGRGPESRSSFVLHLHGPWGSGKTSLLKFLRSELQPARAAAKAGADESLRWVVVEFNAWQHQRISPPWWPLLDSVSQQASNQIRDNFGEGWHARVIRLREWWWRFSTGRKVYLLTAVIAFALALLLYLLTKANVFTGEWEGILTSAKSFVAYAGIVVGVWSTVQHVSRSLISGSSRSAQAFMETAGDPMERICAHFREMLGWVRRPVVIFIDDLDRCQPKYVVDLLEGIQTLFSDPRVVYVIAADRRWLNTCFEKAYQDFSDAVKEPGRRLGSLFLEKAFELSVSVPRMSGDMRKVYWDYLVRGAQADIEQVIEDESTRVRDEFVDAETEEQVFARLRAGTGAEAGDDGQNALRDQVRRGAAVRRLASRKIVESTEFFLKPFAPLLEPNPRAMKRLVNAYAVLRDMALLAGVNVLGDITQRKQLALWAIVSLRWPLLEEYLEAYPEVIDLIASGEMDKGEMLVNADTNLQKLVESSDVKSVFKGEAVGTSLSSATVRKIIGISDAHATAASVA